MKNLFLSAVCALLLAACAANGSAAPAGDVRSEAAPVSPPRAVQAPAQVTARSVVNAQNAFGLSLLKELVKQAPDGSVFISPTSIAMALSMTLDGARGKTREAMAAVLESGDLTQEDIHQANAALLATLSSADKEVRISIANSIWARKGMPLADAFVQTNEDHYAARVSELEFGSPKAVATINDWVKGQTGGRIPSIIDAIRPDDVMFLVNAVYFKGNWTWRFDPKQTAERAFHPADGKTKQHPMMSREGEYAFLENEELQAIRLPYGEDRLAMYVFLPAPGIAVTELVRGLTEGELTGYVDGLRKREGRIVLPRFKLEYSQSLNRVLKVMGMAVAFSPAEADFSGMVSDPDYGPLCISEVRHKTFVEVNEEGTEAAAATSVGVMLTAISPEARFEMVVDRPFFCTIRDDRTGALLFVGVVADPQ